MSQVVVDDYLLNKLHNLTEPLKLCDPSGRVLARVLPVPDLSDYEPWEPPPLSKEEIQRRLAPDQERYTTAEVIAYLESLP